MDFKPKEKSINCAFSCTPTELKKLDALAEFYKQTRSSVVQTMINHIHNELPPEAQIKDGN